MISKDFLEYELVIDSMSAVMIAMQRTLGKD